MKVTDWDYDAHANLVSITCENNGKIYKFENRYAKWVRDEEPNDILMHTEHCSLCNCSVQIYGIYTAYGVGYYYCPGCGAKMNPKEIKPQDCCTSYRNGRCMGTREMDPCNCHGDQTQCDFYDYIREQSKEVKE